MFLQRISRKISFRLAVGFCLLFFTSSAAVFLFVYHLFSYSLENRDHEIIQTKARELTALYEADGAESLKSYVQKKLARTEQNSFMVQLLAPDGRSQFVYVPEHLNRFFSDPHELVHRSKSDDGEWSGIALKNDEDSLELWTVPLRDGVHLQVGKSDEDRNDLLEMLQGIFAFGAVTAAAIGIVGSVWHSNKVVSPLRKLNEAIRTVQAGDFAARVPVKKTGDEIEMLITVFNEMVDRIQQLIRGMRDDLDIVAHDFRTPLTRLRAKAEIALQETSSGPAQEALLECMDSSTELLTMINAILDISEAESGAMRLRIKPLNLSEMLSQVHDLYEPVAQERNIAMSVRATEDAIGLADDQRFKRVLANLVDNAVKYTESGGRVEISAERSNDRVRITVSDTGPGIAPQDLPRVWNRFYRTEEGRARPGFGLGLSVAKSIIEAQGGSIEVDSRLGEGSKFTLSVPGAPSEA